MKRREKERTKQLPFGKKLRGKIKIFLRELLGKFAGLRIATLPARRLVNSSAPCPGPLSVCDVGSVRGWW